MLTQLQPYAAQAAAVLALVILFGYYVIVWFLVGRDPRKGHIVLSATPPDGLTPAAMRYLRERNLDDRGHAALLVGLAVKGYLALQRSADTFSLRCAGDKADAAIGKLQAAFTDGQSRDMMDLADLLDLSPDRTLALVRKAAAQGMPVEIADNTIRIHASGRTMTQTLPPMDEDETQIYDHLICKRRSLLLDNAQCQFIKDGLEPVTAAVETRLGGDRFFRTNTRYILIGWLLSLVLAALLAFVVLHPAFRETFHIATSDSEGDEWVVFVVGGLFSLIGFAGFTYLAIPSWAGLFTARNAGQGRSNGCAALFFTIFFGAFFLMGSLAALAGSVIWGGYYVAALICNRLFSPLLKAYTPDGRRLLDAIDGFRRYLACTNPEEWRALALPPVTPQLFEQYLPHAIALDVEYQWAQHYQAQQPTGAAAGYTPRWVGGLSFGPNSLPHDIAVLANTLISAISSATTPPKQR